MNLYPQALLSAESLGLLRQLITLRLGLQVRSGDEESLQHKLQHRIKALRLKSGESYYQLLTAKHEQSDQEWQELAIALTIPETYFFRDRGQFKILREMILPDLIRQRAHCRTLKIWSAGCSTGEEAYSLAILMSELLPHKEDWKITICGTDINHQVIHKAKQAIYNSWSFRQVDPQIQSRYFLPIAQGWQLKPEFKQQVSFHVLNLVSDTFPTSQWQQVDLILCRNVFVYFEKSAIAKVVQKFYHTLQTGGYLITAHSELQGVNLGSFQSKLYPESLVYQKVAAESLERFTSVPEFSQPVTPEQEFKAIVSQTNSHPVFREEIPSTSPADLEAELTQKLTQAQTLVFQKKYLESLIIIQDILQQYPQHFSTQLMAAEIQANLGNYSQAIQHCQKCLEVDDLAVPPYRILAQISEEKNDVDSAKLLWKKIIYLEPRDISAYLALASLYDHSQESKRANKLRLVAWELLRGMPPEQIILGQNQITVQDLSKQLEKLLILE